MQFTTTTTILSLFLTLTSASPTPNPNPKPASCIPRRAYPLSLPSLSPVASINPLNRPDLGLENVHKPEIAFIISEESLATHKGPCALTASFPKDYEIVDTSVAAGGQPLPLNFFALDGPANGSLVGTTRLPTFLPNQRTKEDVKVVINSFACRHYQAFRIELGGIGEVGFVSDRVNGLYLEYGC
ncbi:hypothetical protein QBC44DRAFT_32477 [Cladorrhinum sp. PSN332]|nr:hypothetical protein QBC44DRAFT_32477 [Cladorrhinum sp. PSN332]